MIEVGQVVDYHLTTSDAAYIKKYLPSSELKAGDAVRAVVRHVRGEILNLRVVIMNDNYDWLSVTGAIRGPGRGQYQERTSA